MTVWFLWEGRAGVGLADEGFLWYGIQRVLQGEVPIRDFMAYDPGRYYLSAALMALPGGGVLSLRGALALVQGVALFVALLLISRTAKQHDLWLLGLAAFTLAAWIVPRHKAFDIAISVGLVAVLAAVATKPSARRLFLCGFYVGIAAVFGRNHGVYGALASLGLILLVITKPQAPLLPRGLLTWGSGIALGYLPLLLMLMLVPGFAGAFWDSVRFHWEIKATNLPLPVPWPWRVDLADGLSVEAIRSWLTGVLFLAVLLFGLLGPLAALALRLRGVETRPVLAGAAFAALPYAHVAFARADPNHLAQGIFPTLIAALAGIALLSRVPRRLLAAAACAASLFIIMPIHPGAACFGGTNCERVAVDGTTLRMDPQSAADLALLRSLAAEHAPETRPFLAAPLWPGAYALLHRRAPIWEIYALFPRGEPFQRAEIARLQAADPGFAVVVDVALDGRDELRFARTHPLIADYLEENFLRRDDLTTNAAYTVYISPDHLR